MRQGKFYMHKNSLDVCIRVRKPSHGFPFFKKITVDYYNLGYMGQPFVVETGVKIKTNRIAEQDWVKLTTAQLFTKRLVGGLP